MKRKKWKPKPKPPPHPRSKLAYTLYKGVGRYDDLKWGVKVTMTAGRGLDLTYLVGRFQYPKEAAQAWDRTMIEVLGEDFADLNFPDEREQRIREIKGSYRRKDESSLDRVIHLLKTKRVREPKKVTPSVTPSGR